MSPITIINTYVLTSKLKEREKKAKEKKKGKEKTCRVDSDPAQAPRPS